MTEDTQEPALSEWEIAGRRAAYELLQQIGSGEWNLRRALSHYETLIEGLKA